MCLQPLCKQGDNLWLRALGIGLRSAVRVHQRSRQYGWLRWEQSSSWGYPHYSRRGFRTWARKFTNRGCSVIGGVLRWPHSFWWICTWTLARILQNHWTRQDLWFCTARLDIGVILGIESWSRWGLMWWTRMEDTNRFWKEVSKHCRHLKSSCDAACDSLYHNFYFRHSTSASLGVSAILCNMCWNLNRLLPYQTSEHFKSSSLPCVQFFTVSPLYCRYCYYYPSSYELDSMTIP